MSINEPCCSAALWKTQTSALSQATRFF